MVDKPLIGVAAAVLVLAAGTGYYLHNRTAPPATVAATAQPPPSAAAPAEGSIEHPLPDALEAPGSTLPLPELAQSDAALRDALAQAAGGAAVRDYLLWENIIRRLVVTADNLPRQKVAVDKRPTAPAAGSFRAVGDELHSTLDPRNFERYQPLVAAVGKLDMRQVAAVYVHFYPLFQRAYQDLGYPSGYFNDRLVQTIDDLLAAPRLAGPVELVRPNVMFLFADPALESRSAGQKLLIRMGPDNAAVIKAKLGELRTAVAAEPPKR